MEQAMHAARLVAAQSALSALLDEQASEVGADAVVVTFTRDAEMGPFIDVAFTRNGMHVAGEGV